MQLQFVTVDVFTNRQFGGNPLAVVLNAEGLTTTQMQSVAAEFNLAETTFVLPPKDMAHTAQVRIFTPRAELPFAGHPNVGTAYALAREGSAYGRRLDGRNLIFEEIANLVSIELLGEGDTTITGARLSSPQRLSIGDSIAIDVAAEACSLSPDDLATDRHQPCVASCGIPLVFAQVKTRQALAKARVRESVFVEHLPRDRITGIHLYAHDGQDGIDIQCRMFAPLHGIPEDPATGAANVTLIGLLASLAPESDTRLEKRIGQGFDMGRPSLLEALAVKRAGVVSETLIGGSCIPVVKRANCLLRRLNNFGAVYAIGCNCGSFY